MGLLSSVFISLYLLHQVIGDLLLSPVWGRGKVSIQGLIEQIPMAREHVKRQGRIWEREDKRVRSA
jgi:hypothetical protein